MAIVSKKWILKTQGGLDWVRMTKWCCRHNWRYTATSDSGPLLNYFDPIVTLTHVCSSYEIIPCIHRNQLFMMSLYETHIISAMYDVNKFYGRGNIFLHTNRIPYTKRYFNPNTEAIQAFGKARRTNFNLNIPKELLFYTLSA